MLPNRKCFKSCLVVAQNANTKVFFLRSRCVSEGHHVRRRQCLQPAADQRVLRKQLAELLPPSCGGPALRTSTATRKRGQFSRQVLQICNLTCFFFCSPQLNIMSFISELLQWFEVKKPDFVQPVQATDLTGVYRLGHQTDFSSLAL